VAVDVDRVLLCTLPNGKNPRVASSFSVRPVATLPAIPALIGSGAALALWQCSTVGCDGNTTIADIRDNELRAEGRYKAISSYTVSVQCKRLLTG
jgi:hypothetical protein